MKEKYKDELERKYKIRRRGLRVAKEEIRQKIKAKTGKITRYQQRVSQYQQNRLFRNNEGRFYQQLNNESEHLENEVPDAETARNFWSDIWSKEVQHNKNANWLHEFRNEVENTSVQESIDITDEKVKDILKRMPNWKAPGPDGVQGFWLKNFTSMHKYIRLYLIDCLENGTPTWMTKGRTVLIQKDKDKGRDASNYRPITCLPLMWKLLTGMIADQMYNYLETNNLLPEEQKGCRKRSKGTADLLYIDRMILREERARKKNLGIGWIDYQKAYDNVAHSWVLECLTILGINEKVTSFLKNSMKSWEVELKCGNKSLGNVKIRRGIFQGDSLSPLLFVMALIPLTRERRRRGRGNGQCCALSLCLMQIRIEARSFWSETWNGAGVSLED